MASTDSSSFGILGSSKLNTADGKNPSSATAAQKIQEAGEAVKQAAGGASNSEDYKKQCLAAHDALEDKLREEERLAREFSPYLPAGISSRLPWYRHDC